MITLEGVLRPCCTKLNKLSSVTVSVFLVVTGCFCCCDNDGGKGGESDGSGIGDDNGGGGGGGFDGDRSVGVWMSS